MIRFCIRQAVRVFAGAAFFACALSAQSATFSFNDPNCASFTLQGSAGNYTLACASLSCNIIATPTANPQPGTGVSLQATCSPAASSVTWSAGASNDPACPAVVGPTSNPLAVSAPVLTGGGFATVNGCVYQVAATSTSNGGGSASTNVSWSNVVVTKPSQCSITANQNPLPAGGGTVTLTASCAGGSAVDSWTNWTGPTTTVSGNTAVASLTQAASFTVTANNGGGSTTTPSFTENVATSGGGGGAINCSAQGFTGTTVLTENWPNWLTNQNGNMGPNDALVVKFTTGATALTQTGKIVLFSGSGQDSAHDVFVSSTPCDFTTNILPNLKFSIGTKLPGIPMLSTNSTYYINIRNSAGALCTLPNSGVTCSLVNGVSLYTPPR